MNSQSTLVSGHDNVYTGTWVDWSKGSIFGATLTVTSRNGTLLIAFLALFISVVGTQFWRTACYGMHHYFSSKESRDALHHQRQAILRNAANGTYGLCISALALWAWARDKTAARPYRQLLPLMVIAVCITLGFAAASTFSSKIAGAPSNHVLLSSPLCGSLDIADGANKNDLYRYFYPYQAEVLSSDASYAQQCYPDETSARCEQYVKRRLPVTVTRNASCPFQKDPSICKLAEGNIILDTGYLDSHFDLGINAPEKDRVQFRRVTTCAPLVTEGYKDSVQVEGAEANYTRYFYGPNTAQSSEPNAPTYVYPEWSFSEWKTSSFISGEKGDYSLGGNQYRTQNGQINTTWGTWTPIPSLMMPDADVTLTFLSPNWILFAEEVDDPLYSAHRHIAKLRGDTGEGSGATIDAIIADEPASPLICISQQQYCNPNLDAGARCAPMASSLDSFRLGEALWPDEQQKRIYRWLWLLIDSSADIAAVQGTLSTSSLLSRFRKQSGFQGPLAEDQWQQDLEYQHNVSLSNLQRMAVLFANGPSDPDVLRYRQPPRNAQERRLCRSQKVFSRAYLNFSILGLSLTLAIGSAIVVLSYVLEPVVSYLQRRRNLDPYARLEWASNEMLQLQRLAHEELGVGSWRRCLEAVPTTGREERLAVLDVGDLEHPRLRAVGPGLEVVIAVESEEGRSLVNMEDEKEGGEVAVEGVGREDEDIVLLEIDERRIHKTTIAPIINTIM